MLRWEGRNNDDDEILLDVLCFATGTLNHHFSSYLILLRRIFSITRALAPTMAVAVSIPGNLSDILIAALSKAVTSK